LRLAPVTRFAAHPHNLGAISPFLSCAAAWVAVVRACLFAGAADLSGRQLLRSVPRAAAVLSYETDYYHSVVVCQCAFTKACAVNA